MNGVQSSGDHQHCGVGEAVVGEMGDGFSETDNPRSSEDILGANCEVT